MLPGRCLEDGRLHGTRIISVVPQARRSCGLLEAGDRQKREQLAFMYK